MSVGCVPGAVDVAERLVCREAGPDAEAHFLVHRSDTGRIPAVLRPDLDDADALEGGFVLVPLHRRVLDRLAFQVATELNPEFPFSGDLTHLGLHRLTDRVGRPEASISVPVSAVSAGATGATENLAM